LLARHTLRPSLTLATTIRKAAKWELYAPLSSVVESRLSKQRLPTRRSFTVNAAAVMVGVGSATLSQTYTRCASTIAAEKEEPLPELKLFMYSVCPFCNKLKAFMDYHRLSYEVVEVNPMNKNELKFSEYKKVPVVLMDSEQLNDSSVIIQRLGEVLAKREGAQLTAIGDNATPGGASPEKLQELSVWAEKNLVPALTCSIYRTPSESMQAMQYIISHPGFSWYQKMLNQYIGGALMYVVSKRIKKKNNIVDERQAVYQAISTWLAEVGEREFLGGSAPCRVDLEVFGYLRAIQDMDTFSDSLKNTKLAGWYRAMEDQVPAPVLK